ncbi:MAG: phosphomannomutase/phosphoglucomutase [Candidatus Omnitrophica bacterium]|nr:phosphomannomutase/phosphoglucomutase [Candidatus Omnitrophota bacterium]MCM8809056.1 phosphomannomutase/phosphoglucomutase [Candidatus Omnitrophota bacterium]MCM8810442.1 phosphomannomutase/phosphoglucomutase [Candidatus Omnitrophota bacterium]
MRINRTIFREYDIRGIYQQDLKGDFPYFIGKAFGTYIKRKNMKSVCVGGDNRLTTNEIKEKLIKGLIDTGCEVTDIGIVPTPVLYFSIHFFNFDSGIMVTASHNPPQFNGFKMVVRKSSLYGKEIQEIADLIEKEDFEKGKGKVEKKDVENDYINFMLEKFKFNKKLKVGIDTGNGTTGPLIEKIFKKLGIEFIGLYIKSDGNFPNHLPDPVVPENLKDLIEVVKKNNLDCGFGFDGDGDRLAVIDENGEILWGDKLMIIYSKDVLSKKKGAKIIFDVKCSKSLEEEIEKYGGIPIMWKTGHSLIENKLHLEKAPIAGELSGHLYFADEYFGYDDAIYACLRLLRILDNENKKISEFFEGVKKYYSTPEIRIEVPDDRKFEIVENVKKYYSEKYEINDIDGVKVYYPSGWALLRASNTQPALVVRIEGETEEILNKIKEEFFEVIEKYK